MQKRLVCEIVGGEPYEYFPLGQYIVAAPDICGGRPTFKYTRVEPAGILRLLAVGWSIEKVVEQYDRPEISREAIQEALRLASAELEAA